MRRIILTLLFLYSLFFVICSILSPIFAKLGLYRASAKLFFLFAGSCHQQPHLSFWLAGYPMPLCCRCIGVYTGSTISSVLFAADKIKIKISVYLILLLITIIDLVFNYLLNINTGKLLRFGTGIIMGFLIISSINYILTKIKRRTSND